MVDNDDNHHDNACNGSNENPEKTNKGGRKRLSRKEQKARRKKHKKAHPNNNNKTLTTTPSSTSISASDVTKEKSATNKVDKDKNSKNSSQSLDDEPVEYYDKYIPTPIPSLNDLQKQNQTKNNHHNGKHSNSQQQQQQPSSLGKWFPAAVVMKARRPPRPGSDAALLLFYQYVTPTLWSQDRAQQFANFLVQIGQRRCLGGRLRVAREGINATISSRNVVVDEETGEMMEEETTNGNNNNNNNQSRRRRILKAATILQHFTQDLQRFDPETFGATDFKFITDLSGDRHFKDYKVFPVKELVYYGLDSQTAPLTKGGTHLAAADFHQKLQERDTVVVDVRNHYEAAIGRFDGQMMMEPEQQPQQQQQQPEEEGAKDKKKSKKKKTNTEEEEEEETKTTQDETKTTSNNDNEDDNKETTTTAATYIDPKMRKSTDFTHWLSQPETQQQLQGKQVLLYCTGGVRCERASAYLNHSMGPQVKGVYQLQGGIERYLQAFPDGGFWRGKNFVFDKREAFGVDNPDGDGGVVEKKKKKKKKSGNQDKDDTSLLPEMKCCLCQAPWDRYVGKKKCSTCGVPVLMCDSCMSSQNKKGKGGDNRNKKNQQNNKDKSSSAATNNITTMVRCPLCVEQNVTVAASDVEWTDNGIVPVAHHSSHDADTTTESTTKTKNATPKGKVAPSVLKWGGGHAAEKKERRRFKRKPCKFGAACQRPDCFFAHPTTTEGAEQEQEQGAQKRGRQDATD